MKQKEKWAIEWLAKDPGFQGVDKYHLKIWLAGFEYAKEMATQLADESPDQCQCACHIEDLGEEEVA